MNVGRIGCWIARIVLVASAAAGGAIAQMPRVSLATGDVDRDGYDDVAIVDSYGGGWKGGGSLHVVNGKTGACMWSRANFATERARVLGVTIVARGVAESLVVAAVRDEMTGELRLDLLRGANGELLLSHHLPPTLKEYDCFLAAVDDIDGDGVVELAVARQCFSRVAAFEGRISLVSLRDGCELVAIEGGRERRLLGRQLAVGEFDQDAGLDLVVTAYAGPGPHLSSSDFSVLWLSGRTLSPIFERYSENCHVQIGTSLAPCGNVDGDGLDEVAIGALRTLNSEGYDCEAEARLTSAAPGEPLRTFLVRGAHDEDPCVAVLATRTSHRFVAIGTPRERILGGVWRVFDESGAVVRMEEDEPRDYYPIAMAALGARDEATSRLVIVGSRLEDEVDHNLIDLECWGGSTWRRRLWRYELEPPTKAPR